MTTYAGPWIGKFIRDALAEEIKDTSVGLTSRDAQFQQIVFAVQGRLSAETGRKPTREEIFAAANGVSLRQVGRILDSQVPDSLDRPRIIDDERAGTFGENLPDGRSDSYGVATRILDIKAAFCGPEFEEVERRVIELRYGFLETDETDETDESTGLSYDAIASRLGIPTHWVKIHERTALAKLKESLGGLDYLIA